MHHEQWIVRVLWGEVMRKLLIVATALTALISGEALAGKSSYTTSSTIVYNGSTYTYSSTSTCADGTAALRKNRKWWCPVTSSTTTSTTSSTTSSGTTTATATPVSYNASISWSIPATRADGTPLSTGELSGYEVYYTNDSGSVNVAVPVSGGSTANTVVSSLASGNYYFSISAIDTGGLKSALSAMALVTFP